MNYFFRKGCWCIVMLHIVNSSLPTESSERAFNFCHILIHKNWISTLVTTDN